MKKSVAISSLVIAVFAFVSVLKLNAQVITYPPSGDNQKSVVTQYMGFVEVTITYHSPDVTSPKGESRKGKIWGELVPYGMANLGFGWSSEENKSPWRAGANENTTISFSEDVLLEGKKVKAGKYGLFMIPGKDKWTIILSSNSTSWGSYFYNPEEDVLRVDVQAEKSPYHEYLTYDFDERKLESCVAVLKWEELAVPFKISIPDFKELYIQKIEAELRSELGFYWQSWSKAANFCVTYGTHLEDGLEWANFAIDGPYVGQKNFTTLQTKASVLFALKRNEEAKKVVLEAVNDPTATAFQVHQYGRTLIKKGQKELAMKVMQANYKRYKAAWPTNVGMARAYSAMGEYKKALKYAEKAYKEAPDELNKNGMKMAIEALKEGHDIN